MNKEKIMQAGQGMADVLKKTVFNGGEPEERMMSQEAAGGRGSARRTGILSFIGNLLTNSMFLGSGRAETAPLRGTLAGLASGVDAAAREKDVPPGQRKGSLGVALTAAGYIAGGLLAAMIYRSMRRAQLSS